MSPRIKICCISSQEEASLAIRYGASALGLVSHMPSGPGVITDDLIAEIAGTVPPPIATFLLTALQDAEAIADLYLKCRTSVLQLVDEVPTSELARLRRLLPTVKLVQVIHVLGEDSVVQAAAVASHVDALLLDSGNPTLKVKELGGTGRVHDWALSRAICRQVSVPVFLAGGLRTENVVAAVKQVRPFGLDLCSGVRTDGRLDEEKLAAFMHAAIGTA